MRERAYHYLAKPIERETLLALVNEMLGQKSDTPPIEVVSARPEWVELLVPCSMEAATRLEAFMVHLEAGLSEEVRNSVAQAFHELLMNAIEWGGKLNPKRRVRISYLRAKRMLLYRIADPGPGFKHADLDHAAISHGSPIDHGLIRERKRPAPRRVWAGAGSGQGGRTALQRSTERSGICEVSRLGHLTPFCTLTRGASPWYLGNIDPVGWAD